MNNESFRGLLDQIKAESSNASKNKGGGEGGASSELSKTKKDQMERAKKYKKKQEKKEEKDTAKEVVMNKYRDRASERRIGDAMEYTDITAEEAQSISIENSKYLGGDEAHTHLVKGLDPLLLTKMRKQMEEQRKLEQNQMKETENKPSIHFETNQGRLLYKILISDPEEAKSAKIKSNESFLPGRMSYNFELPVEDTDPDTEDMPFASLKAKEDLPALKNEVFCFVNAQILSRLEVSMAKLNQGGKKRKRKKTLEQDNTSNPNEIIAEDEGEEEVDDDEEEKQREKEMMIKKEEEEKKKALTNISIFPNISKYEPNINNKNNASPSSSFLSTKQILSSSIMEKYSSKPPSAENKYKSNEALEMPPPAKKIKM